MTDLVQCSSCSEYIARTAGVCPLCGDRAGSSKAIRGAAVLLGLSLAVTGCGDKDSGTGTPTGTVQPEYGVPTTSRAIEHDPAGLVAAIVPPECER